MDEETLRFRIKFGLRIKEIRTIKKIEQGVLSAVLGKDKQFINRYENEGANPRADIVQEIAKALNLEKIDELYDFRTLDESEIERVYQKIKNR